MKDLSLCSFDEIMDEHDAFTYWYEGNYTQVLGLCERLKQKMLDDIKPLDTNYED